MNNMNNNIIFVNFKIKQVHLTDQQSMYMYATLQYTHNCTSSQFLAIALEISNSTVMNQLSS